MSEASEHSVRILILGAGHGWPRLRRCSWLATGTSRRARTRRGPAATAGERAGAAWDGWRRPRRQPVPAAALRKLPRWWGQLRAELPEVGNSLEAAGALHLRDLMGALPVARRGAMRDGDERFETVTARRPILEAVLSAAAEAAGSSSSGAGRRRRRPDHGLALAGASGDRSAHRRRRPDHR